MERNCIILIRKSPTGNKELDQHSNAIKIISILILEKRTFKFEQIDPRDYGIEDSRLFKFIKSADVMILTRCWDFHQ